MIRRTVKVRKVSKSTVITLPGDMPEYIGVKPGDYVMLSVDAPGPNGLRPIRIEKADTMEPR